MRLVIHEYANGGGITYETSDDGSSEYRELAGQRQVGERICAFVEVLCDSTEDGYDRALEALARLTKEIEKRKRTVASLAG